MIIANELAYGPGMNDDRAFFNLLDELGIPSQTVEHEAVLTAEGLARRDISNW